MRRLHHFDKQPFDIDFINYDVNFAPVPLFGVLPNNEGFQLVTSAGNIRGVYPSPLIQVDWNSMAGLRPSRICGRGEDLAGFDQHD